MNDSEMAGKKEARRKFRARVGKLLEPFDCYGLGVMIPETAKHVIDAGEELVKDMKEAENAN